MIRVEKMTVKMHITALVEFITTNLAITNLRFAVTDQKSLIYRYI